jgi:hypothetical protein
VVDQGQLLPDQSISSQVHSRFIAAMPFVIFPIAVVSVAIGASVDTTAKPFVILACR